MLFTVLALTSPSIVYRQTSNIRRTNPQNWYVSRLVLQLCLLSGEPDYFGRNEISSGGDLSHYSSASLY